MSQRIDNFCNNLRDQLNGVETRMESFKSKLQAAPKQVQDAVQKQLEQAKQKVESQKRAVAQAKAKVQSWSDQKIAEAKAAVETWKADVEAQHLANRADRAEDYAVAAVLIAQSSIDEAEAALFEAIAARLDADAVVAH
jgi:TolA-binding protein